MNSITSLTHFLMRRAARPACFGIAAALAATASAQTFFVEDFDSGDVPDAATWGIGSTGSVGTQTIFDGYAVFDTVVGTANTRTGAVTHVHDLNVFANAIEVVYRNIFVSGDPVVQSATLASVGFYSSVGRYPGDEGGAADGALASSMGVGGGYPGSLGFQLLKFQNGTWRLQIIDSGLPAALVQTQIVLSGPATDIVFGIDGDNSQFYMQIEGATFDTFAVNNLGVTIHSDTLISGPFVNFKEWYTYEKDGETEEGGIRVGGAEGTVVSRLAIGAFSGTFGSVGPTVAELDSVEVRAYNPPAFPATSIFAEYTDVSGWRNTSVVAGSGMGWVYDAEYPYIWLHDAQGWFYVSDEGASASSFWAWNYNTSGWIWSSVDWNGWYWDHNTGTALQF